MSSPRAIKVLSIMFIIDKNTNVYKYMFTISFSYIRIRVFC